MNWKSCFALLGMGAFCVAICATGQTTASVAATNANIRSVTVTPGSLTLVPGATQQFTATVVGEGSIDTSVTWAVNGKAATSKAPGGDASIGTITSTGIYATPYPFPATPVTITATSTVDSSKSGNAKVSLVAPALSAGPALTVDAGAQSRPISPLIYGMNFYTLTNEVSRAARITLDRWGGDNTSRYNYKLDISNASVDWFFEAFPSSSSPLPDNSSFNKQFLDDQKNGAKTLCTVPVNGWVATVVPPGPKARVCGFSAAKYGPQEKVDPRFPDCGNGMKPDGKTQITGNDPHDTSTAVDASWTYDWVKYLVGKFGSAASGKGIAIYGLDNEPSWWNGNHRDVHPLPFTYDEVTDNGIAVAKAVKAADPTAEISGPVIDFWPNYFYSKKDIEAGWATPPGNYSDNPVDRQTHGNVPLLEYYLQQFKKAQDADEKHTRFLDYLDIHTYFAAGGGLNHAGATDTQQAMINSTRSLWDPTYTDPIITDPNDPSKTPSVIAPMIIRRMQTWIAKNYPGTKTAITEYNWGAMEHISGGVALADVLGIFGREGLDMATLWGPPVLGNKNEEGEPNIPQYPGLNAFMIYRNYDGAGGSFGDAALNSTSADQGKLSVYGAMRTADKALTIVVINKTYRDLVTTLSLPNVKPSGPAKVFLYSNASLRTIVAQPGVEIPAPTTAASSAIHATYPAMSITLYVIPTM